MNSAEWRTRRGFPPSEAYPHGTRARYVCGCRCADCRRATADYERCRLERANAAARDLPLAAPVLIARSWAGGTRIVKTCPGADGRPCIKRRGVRSDSPGGRCADCRWALLLGALVSAAPARRHLIALARHAVGRRSVHASSDVAVTIVQEIRQGRKRRIRRQTAQRILAVSAQGRADHSLVPAASTWTIIRRLLDEGYTRGWIARALGAQRPALQLGRRRVLARTELRVRRLYRRLTA